MSETTMNHEDIIGEVIELTKEEEDRMYKQGLQDFVAGNRETAEANYYISYWRQQQLGEAALKTSAQ